MNDELKIRRVLARFKATGMGNEFLACEGFGISYNEHTGSGGMFGLSFFAGDDNTGETALVVGNDFFILNGDHRREYAAILDEGLGAVVRYFLSKPDEVSSWSDSVADARALIEAAA